MSLLFAISQVHSQNCSLSYSLVYFDSNLDPSKNTFLYGHRGPRNQVCLDFHISYNEDHLLTFFILFLRFKIN